jgi:hypothetical protein
VQVPDQTPASRLSLAAIAAISVLLAIAAPTDAETATAAGAISTPTPATESAAPVEQVQAPTGSPEPATDTEPVEVPTVSSAAESAGAAVESTPAASPPPSIPSPAATPVEVKAPAETEPNGSTAPALLQHASSQVTGIRERSAKAVEPVVDRLPPADIPAPQETVQGVLPQVPGIGRLSEVGLPEVPISTPIAGEVARSFPLLGRVTSAVMEGLPSAGELPVIDWGASRDEVSSLPGPAPLAGLFPYDPIGVQDGPFVEGLTGPGSDEPRWLGARALLSDAKEPLVAPTTLVGNEVHLDAGLGRSPGGIAPLDRPLPPIPGSPGAAVPGSAGSFFVPLAALLALLALVAPATLRRLRAAPGFRPPIPFVCALERPG